MKSYLERLLIALDILGNTVDDGYPNETYSARCWRMRDKSKWWAFQVRCINALFCNPQHCEDAFNSCKEHVYSPKEEQ
jgi:hypothetical protein